jgi:hypothetical protein
LHTANYVGTRHFDHLGDFAFAFFLLIGSVGAEASGLVANLPASLCFLYMGVAISQSRLDVLRLMFPSSVNRSGAETMLDLVYLLLGLGCFGLMIGYANLCNRL